MGAAAGSFRIRPFVSIIISLLRRAAILSILYKQEFLTFLPGLVRVRDPKSIMSSTGAYSILSVDPLT